MNGPIDEKTQTALGSAIGAAIEDALRQSGETVLQEMIDGAPGPEPKGLLRSEINGGVKVPIDDYPERRVIPLDKPKFSIPPGADVIGTTPSGRPVIQFRNGPFKGRPYAMRPGGGLERAFMQKPSRWK